MKTFLVFSMAAFFSLTAIHIQAQEEQKKEAIKQAIKETKKELKARKMELKKLEKGVVSNRTKDQFIVDFGNIPDVQWKRFDYFDEAAFTKDGLKINAYYDQNAMLIGTGSFKRFEDLPANAQKEIKSKYKDYIVKSVFFFEDNEANDTSIIFYGTQFSDWDNYFVELLKGNERIVIQVNLEGDVFFFKKL
ncbi:hypothetical protein [uncultured Bacteroides sp.]|uniref:hypothetical protein n=1 Tax=uncultured Bacteroides sp. TaxID=162156 RepID=UPI002AABC5A8|nr:hypothetical protein [uncultured Bacteroides sp.]